HERALIEAAAAARLRLPPVQPVAPVIVVQTLYQRARVLGGLGFCILAVAACFLVARRLTGASWPLQGSSIPLVAAAGGAYLASFGFRAFGWRHLFPSHARPDGARCLAACGAAAASGLVLPFRLDYVVQISALRRLRGVSVGIERVALSIVALGLVDAAGALLLSCWTSRALGSALLLSALAARFSPTLALVVLCMSGAASIVPITAGGAVAGMGTTAGVLLALGATRGVAINFALASGL